MSEANAFINQSIYDYENLLKALQEQNLTNAESVESFKQSMKLGPNRLTNGEIELTVFTHLKGTHMLLNHTRSENEIVKAIAAAAAPKRKKEEHVRPHLEERGPIKTL